MTFLWKCFWKEDSPFKRIEKRVIQPSQGWIFYPKTHLIRRNSSPLNIEIYFKSFCFYHKVWNIESGLCLFVLSGHAWSVTCLDEISTLANNVLNGHMLLTGSNDKCIKAWDLSQKNVCLRTFKGHLDWVTCLKVLSQNLFVSGSYDKTIRVWNFAQGDCLNVMKDHFYSIKCFEFLSDKNELVSCSNDKTILVWDLNEFKCTRKIGDANSSATTTCMRYNVVARELLSCSTNGEFKIWNIDTNKCMHTIKTSSPSIFTFEFISRTWNKF